MTTAIFRSIDCQINHIVRNTSKSKTTAHRYHRRMAIPYRIYWLHVQFLWDVKTFVAFRRDRFCCFFLVHFQLSSYHSEWCVCAFGINDIVCLVVSVCFRCLNFSLSVRVLYYTTLFILLNSACTQNTRARTHTHSHSQGARGNLQNDVRNSNTRMNKDIRNA